MGYYANGEGYIVIQGDASKDAVESIRAVLNKEYETDVSTFYGDTAIDFWTDGKYHGEEVESALQEITKFAKFKSGEIDYVGEDKSIWRFKYTPSQTGEYGNGTWVEQSGQIVYLNEDGSIDD